MEKRKTSKKETSSTITTKPLEREFSAGGIVYKKEKDRTLWLITKSKASDLFPKSFWRLPKGWIDDEEDGNNPGPFASGKKKAPEKELEKAALREVREESGTEAKIIEKIGTINYFFTIESRKILKFVTFYLMEYLNNIPEGFDSETSEIAWLPIEEALKKLKNRGEKQILKKASEKLSQGKLF